MATETESDIITLSPDLHASERRVLARLDYVWGLEALEAVVSMAAFSEHEKARIIKSSRGQYALIRAEKGLAAAEAAIWNEVAFHQWLLKRPSAAADAERCP